MLLCIDVGNTNTVLGAYKDTRLLEHWRLETQRGRTADEMGVLLRQLFHTRGLEPDVVSGAMISCVTPTMQPTLIRTLERYFGVVPLTVGPGIRTGMPIFYENPREVGADRIVNAVAAYHRFKEGLVVVDFGTATTFDAINPRG